MNTIDLYEVFKRVPDVSETQARAAASSIVHADDVATKTDLAQLEARLTARMLINNGIIIAAVIAAVGMMHVFLFYALKAAG